MQVEFLSLEVFVEVFRLHSMQYLPSNHTVLPLALWEGSDVISYMFLALFHI